MLTRTQREVPLQDPPFAQYTTFTALRHCVRHRKALTVHGHQIPGCLLLQHLIQPNPMASPILIGIAIFEAISWIVLLSGVGSLQAYCDDNGGVKCGVTYSFGWWITSFQFFVLVWAGFAACAPAKGLRKATVPLLVSVTAIMMVSSNEAYLELEGPGIDSHRSDNFKNRLRCYFAGLIMSMIFNFLWIILAGFDDKDDVAAQKNMSSTAPPPAGPAYAAGPAPAYGPGPMYVQSPTPTVVVQSASPASH